jgi:hypothetical protein
MRRYDPFMIGLFVIVIVLVALWAGSTVVKLDAPESTE